MWTQNLGNPSPGAAFTTFFGSSVRYESISSAGNDFIIGRTRFRRRCSRFPSPTRWFSLFGFPWRLLFVAACWGDGMWRTSYWLPTTWQPISVSRLGHRHRLAVALQNPLATMKTRFISKFLRYSISTSILMLQMVKWCFRWFVFFVARNEADRRNWTTRKRNRHPTWPTVILIHGQLFFLFISKLILTNDSTANSSVYAITFHGCLPGFGASYRVSGRQMDGSSFIAFVSWHYFLIEYLMSLIVLLIKLKWVLGGLSGYRNVLLGFCCVKLIFKLVLLRFTVFY